MSSPDDVPPNDAGSARDTSSTLGSPQTTGATALVTPSALPSLWRRILAFLTIVIGGICGALIGYGFGDISCSDGDCSATIGVFTLVGAVLGAGGVAIVAILALRAMDEWESLGSQQARRASRSQTPR